MTATKFRGRAARVQGPIDRRRIERGVEDDLAWLRRVLGIDERDDSERPPSVARCLVRDTTEYLARPAFDDLQFLVPTSPPGVAAAALRRSDDNRSLATRIAGLGGRGLAKAGLLGLVPGRRIQLPRFALVVELERALGEIELIAVVTLGARRRNRKPVLQLITPAGRVAGYAKVGWSPLTAELVRNEGDVLEAIESRLPSTLAAPAVVHRQDWKDGHVVVTSALPTLSALGSFVGRSPATTVDEIITAISGAGDAGPTGAATPVRDLPLFAEWRDGGLADYLSLDRIRSKHGPTEIRTGLWHGDFAPWNLSRQGRTTTLWDWEFASDGRPIGFDALHYHFECQRRRRHGSNRTALALTIDEAPALLAPFLPPDPKRLERGRPAETDAVVDLYLCELIARELRLDGQRWTGGAMAELGPVAAEMVLARTERRSRRV